MANAILIIFGVVIIALLWISGGTIIDQPSFSGVEGPDTQTNGETISEIVPKRSVGLRIYSAEARAVDPEDEYIEIQADYSNTEAVNLSGFTLQNREGETFTMPQGAGLPYTGRINVKENVMLKPGEKAIIITGKSPINTGFKPNICTGYFNFLYTFKPALPENCPAPDKESGVDDENDACFLYLKTLPGCRAPLPGNIPSNVDFSCREFIDERMSYVGCVEAHKNESGFFSGEWRVYLEENEEIWSNVRESIKLFDQNGNLTAEYSI